MDQGREYIELVKQAQLGDRGSLDDLAELVRGRLHAYIYRIVLRDDIAQDLVQESMLEMFKILDKLQEAELFWPWLRGIGFNKIRHHCKREKRRRMVPISSFVDGDWPERESSGSGTGLANLMGKELRQVVFNVMRMLKPQYRMVLSMRCYEDMEYSEIAELMECSELSVRVLFCRAKKAMYRQLSRRGFGKGALLTILALFGKMTAPSEAAAASVSVTAATAKAGLAADLLGTVASRETVVALTAAGVLAVGATLSPLWVDKAFSWVEQSVVEVKEKLAGDLRATTAIGSLSDERWCYYPSEAGGPVMTRLVKYSPDGGYSYCQRLEDDRANYFFDRAENTIYINNYRAWREDLAVRRLPTDGSELREFLSMVEGRQTEMQYVSSEDSGLLVITRAHGGPEQVTHHYNLLDEEYFRYDWAGDAAVIDNRDAMHKRGWTYFRITGRIDGEEVSGAGRVPFSYAAIKRHEPWVRLQVGERLEIVGSAAGAYVRDMDGGAVTTYPAGNFFKGLARPWMGLHTIDTVRRDAAEQRVWFETKLMPGSTNAEVILSKEQDRLIYTIDMERDVVERIIFSVNDNRGRDAEGEVLFSYTDEVEQPGDEFVEPRKKYYGVQQQEEIGVQWLIRLAEGTLVE
ncbi:MAG: RNA polymerase sigma factor [Planctomycetota bacterium]|jgi:RNA polymerase sigma-70 factor (ECF subfamily)